MLRFVMVELYTYLQLKPENYESFNVTMVELTTSREVVEPYYDSSGYHRIP